MELLFLGHGSFRLVSACGTVVYIDPFAKGDYTLPADLVLVTHEHYDHNKTELVTLKEGGLILRASDFISGKNYLLRTVKDIKITATPAFNKNHKSGCVGYILEADSLKLYFAGDTSYVPFMDTIKGANYAFLPTDGVYNMDAAEATKCANIIGAAHSVPVHTERPEEPFNERVAAAFTPKNRLIIRPGEKLIL